MPIVASLAAFVVSKCLGTYIAIFMVKAEATAKAKQMQRTKNNKNINPEE